MDVEEILTELGAELSPEQKTRAVELFTAAGAADVETATVGLKTSKETILSEKKAAGTKIEELQAQVVETERKRIEATGDLELMRKFTKDQNDKNMEELQDTVKRLQKAESDRDLATIHGDFGSMFVNSTQAKALLKTMVTIGDDGKSTFKDLEGNIVATDPKAFSEWMMAEKSFSNLLKAPASSGGGGTGGEGSPSPSDNQSKFNSLLSKKDKTHAENLELSKLANDMKQESKEI